jgi:5-dehydro-2-deoxygluconokinase
VQYHPGDNAELKARQERQLVRLFDACRKTRHELLLEIIAAPHGPVDATTIAHAMSRLYDLGIRPDWWKLEPNPDPAAWRAIAGTIQGRDPPCRGVVLLGQSAQTETLVAAFKAAAPFRIVKGFAVGRTIFAEPARAWLTGAIDDEAAVGMLASNFAALVEAWRAGKAAAPAGSESR